jgi:hypothetical protein
VAAVSLLAVAVCAAIYAVAFALDCRHDRDSAIAGEKRAQRHAYAQREAAREAEAHAALVSARLERLCPICRDLESERRSLGRRRITIASVYPPH